MLRAQPVIPQEEYCPVPEQVLGRLYRASPHGLDELVASMPPGTRATLALYCYRRTHLQAIGLAIATQCEEFDLRNAGGYAGTALFEKARETPPQNQPSHFQGRRRVTLSTGILTGVVQDHDEEIRAS
jgi:hypothetical protein